MVIAHQAVNAANVQPMNHTYVVSVEDLNMIQRSLPAPAPTWSPP